MMPHQTTEDIINAQEIQVPVNPQPLSDHSAKLGINSTKMCREIRNVGKLEHTLLNDHWVNQVAHRKP